jgi:hypothetical protein
MALTAMAAAGVLAQLSAPAHPFSPRGSCVSRFSTHNSTRYGLADVYRHIIGCHSTQETGVQKALDDGAWQILLATFWDGI